VIAGNVATPEAVIDLENWGADATKVGVGPGKVCITKLKTGFGTGGWQLSALKWCARVATKPIIADGGIRDHGDIAKSVRFGAAMVMIGSLFAGHEESPGQTVEVDGKLFKEYYGSASDFNKGEYKHVEGKRILEPIKGKLADTLREMQAKDVQSSISYAGGTKLHQCRHSARSTTCYIALGGDNAGEHLLMYVLVMVVTGASDKTDIRLDIPSIALSDQQIATLILTSTPGGVLVHGLLLNQGSTATAMNNTSARIRLIANTTANGVVAATVNGNVLSTGLKSPIVGSYTLIPAGALTTDIQVNGVSVPTSGLTATAGADLSLMVLGTPAAPQVTLLSDDNSPPLTSTYAKLRLVHGVNNLNGTVTLTADYSAVATDVAFGAASTPVSVLNSTTYRLESTSPVFSGEMYLATDVYLQSTHVYTVFMLGDNATPLGVLRRDR
jgi:IMP dehydrogenase/GMP reductase